VTEQSTFLDSLFPVCKCGCGAQVRPGRLYATRSCANRVHGLERVGTRRKKAWQEKCGKGRAVETDRYSVKI